MAVRDEILRHLEALDHMRADPGARSDWMILGIEILMRAELARQAEIAKADAAKAAASAGRG